ncbi:integrase, catalytic region, zinc finger, CCHC-type containing protein [Tanacetum coccineum]
MNTTQAQQKALDDALVALADRLEFEKCNMRLKTDIKPKEATFQVVLDALALTPFCQAFLITAEFLPFICKNFRLPLLFISHPSDSRLTRRKSLLMLIHSEKFFGFAPRFQDNENQSNVFLKEREQYFEIQDLKAQLQDKVIAISELKKLIEKMKGKSVETKFEKSSVIRQPNAFKSQRQSILGKPAIFSDSLAKKDFSKSKPVTTQNVSNDFSKPVTAQILPQNVLQIFKNTNVIAPGMYKVHTKPNQTRTPRLPQEIRKTNKHVSFSTGVIHTTSVSQTQHKERKSTKDRVMPNNSQGKKQNVEDHRSRGTNHVIPLTLGKTQQLPIQVCLMAKVQHRLTADGVRITSVLTRPNSSTMVLEQKYNPNPKVKKMFLKLLETETTQMSWNCLYNLMFSELLNGTSPVVSKPIPPPLNIQSTHQTPTQVPTVTAPENIIQAETNTENAQFDDDEFINIFGEDILLVQIYVDDIIFGSTNPKLTKRFEKLMHSKFDMSICVEHEIPFRNLESTNPLEESFINQAKYTQEILKKYGMTLCDSIVHQRLQNTLKADLSGNPGDQTKYHSMVAALMYLPASRPDIVHATCYSCARYPSKPADEKHLTVVEAILSGKPLKTLNMGLWYPKDAGYETNCFSRFRITHAGPYQKAGRTSCIHRTEYVTLSAAAHKFYVENSTHRLWLPLDKIHMYRDSKVAIAISVHSSPTFPYQHIDVRYHCHNMNS